MKRVQRIVLLKDMVIPAGTVFECCDGVTRRFASGNYEATIGLSKDSSGSVVYGFEPNDAALADWFRPEGD